MFDAKTKSRHMGEIHLEESGKVELSRVVQRADSR